MSPMDQDHPLAEDLRELANRMASAARDLQNPTDPAETYEMATTLACENIDAADGASLSMVNRRGRQVINRAATDSSVAEADELQTELGEGPCLNSIEEHETTFSNDLAHDRRWPLWGRQVAEDTGLRSVLSFQLFTHGDTLGALNLYSHDVDAFNPEDRHDGLVLAAHIAIAIAAVDKIDHLDIALASRTVIGQATGMLIERFGITPDVAFAVLARVASQEQTKLREVARSLVETGHLPTVDHPAG